MIDGTVYIYTAVHTNPKDAPEYVGYVVLNGEFLGVRFEGNESADVRSKALAFYEEGRAKREETIANREAARIKAAETRERKKAAAE